MYVITNRNINEEASGLEVFGKAPNTEGPNELRIVHVQGRERFTVTPLEDRPLTAAELDALAAEHRDVFELDVDRRRDWYPSLVAACDLMARANRENRHVLLFVHGYNNDLGDVLKTARTLERLYRVIVVPFSWPANGGGKISGTVAYLSDKDDGRASAGALSRTVQKADFYHRMLTAGLQNRLMREARRKHPDNGEAANALFSRLLEKQCKVTLNLMCHSMGNYVLKHATRPSGSALRELVFDNVSLVAADANNPEHEQWVQLLPTRNRLFVVINENDQALSWSRRKPGAEQLERLGHHLKNLVARNAWYIDVTRNRGVGSDHSYFKGAPAEDNATLRGMFAKMFEGGRAEMALEYHADINVYRST